MQGQDHLDLVWDAVPPGAEPERFAVRRAFLLEHVRAGDRVLDVGCGEGAFADALLRAGCAPVCVEVADEPLRRLRSRFPELDDVRRAVAEKPLPLDDAEVDVVWAGEVVEHVVDVALLLGELRRVLRPGGRLVLTTPDHPLHLRLRLAIVPGAFEEHFAVGADHLRFFTARSLEGALAGEGFSIASLERRAGHLCAVAA